MRLTDQVYEKYNSYSQNQKHYLNLALTLGLLILLIALIYPAINHILQLRRELKDGREVLTKLQEKSVQLDQAKVEYDSVQDKLAVLDEALPKESGLKNYLKRPLELLANKYSLTISGLQFNEVPLSKPQFTETLTIKKLPYSLVVAGNFADFSKFLSDIEHFIRTTQVGSVSIVSTKGGHVTATLRAQTTFLGSMTSLEIPQTGQSAGGNK
ncbi:MAG: type 4a pilus biogenesis protein PilO [bacterium]|nr:type 4a pilus biogenesis protein PilO [bacterium]